jgi:hypothetical protein
VLDDGTDAGGSDVVHLRTQVLAGIRPWRDTFVMAGVAYPRESVAAAVGRAGLGEGAVAVEHGVDPNKAREDGIDLIRRVGR